MSHDDGGVTQTSRVILDPSFLFSDEAIEWLEVPELRQHLVVSWSLWNELEDAESGQKFLPFGVSPDASLMTRVRNALLDGDIARFSHADAEALPWPAQIIVDELLASEDEPLPGVLADEYAFIVSQSVGVVLQRAGRTVEAFGRKGARIVEVSAVQLDRLLGAIRDRLPPEFVRIAKPVANFPRNRPVKLLVIGGGLGVAVAVPILGLPLAIEEALRQGVGVIVGDP